jgi:hypothetical protein
VPIPTDQVAVRSLLELRNGDWISGGENGTLQRWRNGKKTGKPIPTGQGAVRSLLELRNGDWISGGENGSLQRWRNGNMTGVPIPTGQGAVLSLLELSNGEWISGGESGSLKRWRNGKQIGGPIATNGGVIWLLEQQNGNLITAIKAGAGIVQRRLESKKTMDVACSILKDHPALNNPNSDIRAAAQRTCRRQIRY